MVSLDENVDEGVKKEAFKLRRHPGIVLPRTIAVPDKFVKAVNAALSGISII